MTKRAWGSTVAAVTKLLDEYGEMTRAEMEVEIGIPHRQLSGVITRMRRGGPKSQRLLHITRYVQDAEGARRYPRAVYALGDKPDAKKPKSDHKEVRRRYDANKRAKVAAINMSSAGWTRRQIDAFFKKLKGIKHGLTKDVAVSKADAKHKETVVA